MFLPGTAQAPAGASNTTNSTPPIQLSGPIQYPQIPNNQAAFLSQMAPNNAQIPLNQEQYHRYLQMQHAPQESQQYSSQTQQPGYRQNKQHVQLTRMQSSDAEDSEDDSNENPWQEVRSVKRKKMYKPQTQQSENIQLHNRYIPLTQDKKLDANSAAIQKNIPKPPPIFVYGVVDLPQMIQKLQSIAEMEQYTTRSMANNTIKINCTIPETYRKLVKFMNENNIIYHTYQPKEDRAYRVVIKYLHHSVDTHEVADELSSYGHKVRNMINVKQRQTKEPLNLFFVDLEPAENNKDIYKIRQVLNSIVQIEPPKKSKNIVQCLRCQQYGHTKTYCNRPYKCVKCGGPHSTASCSKRPDVPATCALCGGPHPANYKGCDHYTRLYKNNAFNNPRHQCTDLTNNVINQTPTAPPTPRHRITYANAAKNSTPNTISEQNNSESTSTVFNKFLEDFRTMFNQLLQQNSMILNMLTMLIGNRNG